MLRAECSFIGSEPKLPAEVPEDTHYGEFWEKIEKIRNESISISYKLEEIVNKYSQSSFSLKDNDRVLLTASFSELTLRITKVKDEITELDNTYDKNDITYAVNIMSERNRFSDLYLLFCKKQTQLLDKIRDSDKMHIRIAAQIDDENKLDELIDNCPVSVLTDQEISKVVEQLRRYNNPQLIGFWNQVVLRDDSIKHIEQLSQEVLELFNLQLALTKEQGEKIDDICKLISSSLDHVKRSTKSIEKSKERQKKSRKCLWIIVGISVALFIVVIIIVIITTKK